MDSIQSLGYPRRQIEWLEPPDKSFGDVSFRAAFDLAKSEKKTPGQVAALVAESCQQRLENSRLVKTIVAHPSGFLNASINIPNFTAHVLVSSLQANYGRSESGKGRPVLVEHTSVNPNKALHVGHLRNVAIGDCLYRAFSFAGYKPFVLNYIDDSGLQVADIIVGFSYLGFSKEAPPGQKYDHYAGDDVYVSVNKRYEEDPKLKETQKAVLKGIESKDPSIEKLRLEITDRILKEQLKTCWRFGARYDLLVYESDILHSNLWSTFFATLKDKGIARLETDGKLSGCWIVTVEGGSEGEDKVLVRSDGTATYVAKDIPFAALKLGLVKDPFSYSDYTQQPDGSVVFRTNSESGQDLEVPWGNESLTLIDTRQARLQRIIQTILTRASGKDVASEYKYVSYAVISLSSRTASKLEITSEVEIQDKEQKKVVTMSGRHGTYVNADDAIDLVKQKALEETRVRNPGEAKEWYYNVAEKVSIAAMRFSILKQDLDKIIVFDSEDSLKLTGETGPYLLYTYARASSILSKVEKSQLAENPDGSSLQSDEEIELIKTISKFSISVEKTLSNFSPKWVAHYAYSLCESFNRFYESRRVLQEPDVDVKRARIGLIRATRNVLGSCLFVLGIECPERI